MIRIDSRQISGGKSAISSKAKISILIEDIFQQRGTRMRPQNREEKSVDHNLNLSTYLGSTVYNTLVPK